MVKIRGKDKFYVFTELPFRKCKGYPAGGRGEADGIGETHFTGGKAILILTTRVKVIHEFYTGEVGNLILLPQSLRVRPSLLRKGTLVKLSLPSLTKYYLPSCPCDALNSHFLHHPVPAPEHRNYLSLETPESSGAKKRLQVVTMH